MPIVAPTDELLQVGLPPFAMGTGLPAFIEQIPIFHEILSSGSGVDSQPHHAKLMRMTDSANRYARLFLCSISLLILSTTIARAADQAVTYKLLATNKTSTSEKEMNEAADAGFRFGGAMGGDTAWGGSEVVTVMYRLQPEEKGRYAYKLLATTKTSTMQKELQEAGDAGYEYKGQTVFKSAFGGKEVIVILELDRSKKELTRYEYKLLATTKTSTMEKELQEAGASGFEFVGVTVGSSAIGGAEVISILRRVKK